MARRRGRGEGSLFKRTRKRKDGSTAVMWAAEVTVGYDDNGAQKRKTVYGATQREVLDKIADIKGQLAEGTFTDTRTTIAQYLAQWLTLKKLDVKARSYQFYADYVRLYINPHIGRVELSKLKAHHVEAMMKAVAEAAARTPRTRPGTCSWGRSRRPFGKVSSPATLQSPWTGSSTTRER